jgi:hypothetical protein
MKKTTTPNTAKPKDNQPLVDSKKANAGDLTDSPEDEAKLQGEETILDLPEVKDIPGQEHIHVPRMREFADITASSDDEEGAGLLDDLNDPDDDDIEEDDDSNVSAEEAALLQDAADVTPGLEEERLKKTALDSTDDEGEPLNEKGFSNAYSGTDLDVPGSEDDDDDESIGEEDEENNAYSVDEENEDDEKE